jgi:hypothetical protein
MDGETRDVTRRELLSFAAAATGVLITAAPAEAQQQRELPDEQKRVAPLLLLTSSGAELRTMSLPFCVITRG